LRLCGKTWTVKRTAAVLPFLEQLNAEQYAAVTAETNAAVSAGAGSGKTRVLAARYAWLVMRGIKVEEILAITFTNKAANEMYGRIYRLLSDSAENPEARRGVENFHKAAVSTLDSFCASVARTAGRLYGLSPDFSSDKGRVRELARSLALRFVLDNRNNPGLRELIAEKKIRVVADELFAGPILRHSPLSQPLDISACKTRQREELLRGWNEKTTEASRIVAALQEEAVEMVSADFARVLTDALSVEIPAPGIEPLFKSSAGNCTGALPSGDSLRKKIEDYASFLDGISSINMAGRNSEKYFRVKECRNVLKALGEELAAIANYALQWDIVETVYPLMEEYQALFNKRKREAGVLGFTDIARLAVDALIEDIELRQMYKNMFKHIMVDEFQDNNSLQRDLVYLLAEKKECRNRDVPERGDLVEGKLFLVGDEKQSIYGFRGADVSVFRSLAGDFSASAPSGNLRLNRNYRSRPMLIKAFNRIFGGLHEENSAPSAAGIFPPPGKDTAAWEASYTWLESRDENPPDPKPLLHIALLDKGLLGTDSSPLINMSGEEIQAFYIAQTIKKLVDGGETIYDKNTGVARPVRYSDIAVLQRSYTHQRELEQYFKISGIPFSAERSAGLFNDAPLNDFSAFLRLLVYPSDRTAYAALLRSPLIRLSAAAFAACMLDQGEPFCEEAESFVPPEEHEAYRRGRRLYRKFQKDMEICSLPELVSKLWYEEGYRYETMWPARSQAFAGLYDLFFELARHVDEQGGGLPEFLDYLDDVANREEEIEDNDLPGEESGVRLMSIHKCKGLEFPVVFVFNCGQPERSRSGGLALWSRRWGISLHLPTAEELPQKAGNYFSLLEKDESERKTAAELKRLLYVAMTRAECLLYLTASLPARKNTEAEVEDPETEDGAARLRERFSQLCASSAKSGSFLDLLLPVLAEEENPPCLIEMIEPVTQSGIFRTARRGTTAPAFQERSMTEAVSAALPLYGGVSVSGRGRLFPLAIPASALSVPSAAPEQTELQFTDDGELDALLEKSGVQSDEFGTIVHRIIEDRFSVPADTYSPSSPQSIPPRILARIRKNLKSGKNGMAEAVAQKAAGLADTFFASELGRQSLQASFRETEFPVLTAVGKDIVSGTVDLLFEEDGTINIVDFKTGKAEQPRQHAGQLCLYQRAISDIYGKPVSCWLFFVRSGRAVNIDSEILKTNPEELVIIWKKNYLEER
jgi:ATP-dependent helicase/nuclease subunit A